MLFFCCSRLSVGYESTDRRMDIFYNEVFWWIKGGERSNRRLARSFLLSFDCRWLTN